MAPADPGAVISGTLEMEVGDSMTVFTPVGLLLPSPPHPAVDAVYPPTPPPLLLLLPCNE